MQIRRNLWNFLESPESLRSRASHGSRRSPFKRVVVSLRSTTHSLRASLTAFAAVLASAVFPERLAPFSPAQLRPPAPPTRVGLKGAGGSAYPDDVSTAGVSNANDEERNESRESSRRGLSG